MGGVLAQLFVALGASLVIGFVLGITVGVHRRLDADAARSPVLDDPSTPADGGDTGHVDDDDGAPAELADVVEREAALIEALARADEDLHARARELSVANEEITCLLEQLHEARHPTP